MCTPDSHLWKEDLTAHHVSHSVPSIFHSTLSEAFATITEPQWWKTNVSRQQHHPSAYMTGVSHLLCSDCIGASPFPPFCLAHTHSLSLSIHASQGSFEGQGQNTEREREREREREKGGLIVPRCVLWKHMVSDSHCDALEECLSSLTHTYNPGDTQAHADIMLLTTINLQSQSLL